MSTRLCSKKKNVSLYPKVKQPGREANKSDIMKVQCYPFGLTLFFIAWFIIKNREEKLRFAVNRDELAGVPCTG